MDIGNWLFAIISAACCGPDNTEQSGYCSRRLGHCLFASPLAEPGLLDLSRRPSAPARPHASPAGCCAFSGALYPRRDYLFATAPDAYARRGILADAGRRSAPAGDRGERTQARIRQLSSFKERSGSRSAGSWGKTRLEFIRHFEFFSRQLHRLVRLMNFGS